MSQACLSRTLQGMSRTTIVISIVAAVLAAPAAASARDLYAQQDATGVRSDLAPCNLDDAITVADQTPATLDTIHVVGPLEHRGTVDLSRSPIALVGTRD